MDQVPRQHPSLMRALRRVFGLGLSHDDPVASYWSEDKGLKRLLVIVFCLIMLMGQVMAWYGIATGLLFVGCSVSLLGFTGLAILISLVYRPLTSTAAPPT